MTALLNPTLALVLALPRPIGRLMIMSVVSMRALSESLGKRMVLNNQGRSLVG